jgi:uncharacterized membrane protein HdeD (DUF308 family)
MAENVPDVNAVMFMRNWWMMIAMGAVAVIFGIIALIYTTAAVNVIVILVGAFVFLWGIMAIIAGFAAKAVMAKAWPMYLIGIVGIIVGLIMISNTNIGLDLLMLYLGLWAIIMGILFGITAFSAKGNKWVRLLFFLGAIVAIVLGCIFIFDAKDSAQTLMVLVGIFLIIIGAVNLGTGIAGRPKAVKV